VREQFSIRFLGWPLAVLRVCIGILFLRAVQGKLAAGSHWPDGMVAFLNHQRESAFAFYWPFIEKVVIPHKVIFGNLASIGELGIGLLLITGTATRLAAFLGVAMVLNYMWAKGQVWWVPTSHDTLFILVLLTLGIVGAGRVLGIDYFLAKKYPRSWLW
jgi:thiosulfate dehydrogenase [quinone] large subunit